MVRSQQDMEASIRKTFLNKSMHRSKRLEKSERYSTHPLERVHHGFISATVPYSNLDR